MIHIDETIFIVRILGHVPVGEVVTQLPLIDGGSTEMLMESPLKAITENAVEAARLIF